MSDQDSYFIPSSYSRIAARELALQERDLAKLLRGTGLPRDTLLPGDESSMSGQQLLCILGNTRRMSATPEIGLRLGRQLQPSAHGPLGYLALSSPDLITSLESLRDFLPVRLPFVQLQLRNDQDWLHCKLTLKLAPTDADRRLLQECFALLIQSLVESVLGRELKEAQIELAHDKPDYHRLYRKYLHSKVSFGGSNNSFKIPAKLARTPSASSDPDSYALAQSLCRKLLEQVPKSAMTTSDRVKHILLSKTPGTVTESDVAKAIYVSKRTLARRLEQEGESYRGIRERLLSELAARHLGESNLTVESVATLLGYNDAAAFRKAFHRWYRQSPSAYRTAVLRR
jgi:AraC-like DNA-binding protein